MAEHLSALTLDALAAGLEPAPAHLEACAECRARLEALKAERATLMQSPRFVAGLERLAPAPRRSLPRWAGPAIGVALAASLLVFVGSQFFSSIEGDGTRLKGTASLEVLKDGTTPVTQAHVGDKVTVAVGGAGHGQVALFALDAIGQVTVLQPSTSVGSGARVPVGKPFEVTPGSMLLVACFDDLPLPVEMLSNALFARATLTRVNGLSALDTPAPELSQGVCVRTRLEVLP